MIQLDRQTVLHLPSGVRAHVLDVDDHYWERMAEHPELGDGRVVSVFDYTETWDWWERHPAGDEFLYVLEGSMILELQDRSGDRKLGTQNDSSEPKGQELNYSARVSLDRTKMRIDDRMVDLSPGMAFVACTRQDDRSPRCRATSPTRSPLERPR